jgi:hypothetical protein
MDPLLGPANQPRPQPEAHLAPPAVLTLKEGAATEASEQTAYPDARADP